MKTNEYIKRRVVWKIRKSSMDIETWANTSLWDDGKTEIRSELLKRCYFKDGELAILYSFIDELNWTLFTTSAIHILNNQQYSRIDVSDVKDYKYGNFKGYCNQQVERMIVETKDGSAYKCPYETGKMSMGTVYAMQILFNLLQVR